MASIFSKIARGEIPSYKVGESEDHYAFLDINPLAVGHTLVIPKKETDYLFDLDNREYQDLMLFAKKTALAIRKAIPCLRIGVVVYGLDVPHAHIHLIPLHGKGNEIDFSKSKVQLSKEQFEKTADDILKEFSRI